jgi:hypothetical protein
LRAKAERTCKMLFGLVLLVMVGLCILFPVVVVVTCTVGITKLFKEVESYDVKNY